MYKKNKSYVAILLATLLLLTGCATTSQKLGSALDQQAKQFKPSKNYANIYIYRDEYMGGALSMNLHINGKLMGTTGPMTYFMLKVKPGKYKIHSNDDINDSITINAKTKKNYFIWQEMKMGLFVGGTKLSLVDTKTGRKGVLECERMKPNL